jgi:hypothetical protein
VRRQLRKKRIDAFRSEPVGDGNIFVDLPSNTTTSEQRLEDMNNRIDAILRSFPH